MCGICGVYGQFTGGADGEALAGRLVRGLAHRGPDGVGLRRAAANGAAAWLGHARLAVIGVADGAQPLGNEDGTLLLVVNGEIYNHRALRRDLEARGHRFATASDCEVLLHLYEDRGRDFLDGVRGMYAFALWDGRAGAILLGRDRLGKKPLYYRSLPTGHLAFASELTPLLDAGGALGLAEVDPAALRELLGLRYATAPRTIASAVRQLPPAHLAWCVAGNVTLAQYWSPDPTLGPPASLHEARRAVRRAFEDAVGVRLESEVPLGAFLSGGIDSTLVVAAMARAARGPVSTFAIGFAGAPELDERQSARFVAERLGCDHHDEVVSPDATVLLPCLVEHFGEPFADSSALPCWYLARMARQHVTVALSGDGGDELFAGYRRHLAARAAALVARFPGAGVVGAIGAALRYLPRREARRRSTQLARFAERVALPPLARYAAWVALFDRQERARLLEPRWVGPEDELELLLGRELARDPALLARDPVAAVGRIDVGTYLPGDLLAKVDRTSMAHALEVRCPFLDHHLVELAMRLPGRWRLPRWHLKGLLKRAAAADLPPLIARRRKQGFAVPLAAWFRGPLDRWLRDLVLDPTARLRAFCRPEVVSSLIDEHARGGADHGERLWALAVLELWSRRFLAPSGS